MDITSGTTYESTVTVITSGVTCESTGTSITGGITCESTVIDITSAITCESTVISTVMDITGVITCESTVISYKKKKSLMQMSYSGHRTYTGHRKNFIVYAVLILSRHLSTGIAICRFP